MRVEPSTIRSLPLTFRSRFDDSPHDQLELGFAGIDLDEVDWKCDVMRAEYKPVDRKST